MQDLPQHGPAVPGRRKALALSNSLSDLYEAREFTQKRIDEAEHQKDLIGHRNATNDEYQARERDIAGFEKTITEIDVEIQSLRSGPRPDQ